MFEHHCTVCGRTQLMFPGQVRFECWCGTEQVVVTGRKAQQTARQGHVVAA